jgi:hypothetical protein
VTGRSQTGQSSLPRSLTGPACSVRGQGSQSPAALTREGSAGGVGVGIWNNSGNDVGTAGGSGVGGGVGGGGGGAGGGGGGENRSRASSTDANPRQMLPPLNRLPKKRLDRWSPTNTI